MILDLILMVWFHELLEIFNMEGMRQWNTFLAMVRSFKLTKKKGSLLVFFFLWVDTCLTNLDLVMGACLLYEATRVPFFFVKVPTKTGL